MNIVILMGRLTRDPDVRYSNNADGPMAIARYTLAVSRAYKKNTDDTADFINCVAFGKSGEFAEKYLHQGTKIVIKGRIQTGSYTNKDGQKVYTTDVVVENQEFAESKASSTANNANNGFMNIPDGIDDEPLPLNYNANNGFMNIPDGIDDEPFPFN